jgi:amidase
VWQNKGPWIQRAKPRFGPDIARNFAAAARTTEAEAALMRPLRLAISTRLSELLRGGIMLAIPTTPGPAPLRVTSDSELERVRDRTQALTCIVGLVRRSTANQYSRRFCRRRAGWLVISRCAGK